MPNDPTKRNPFSRLIESGGLEGVDRLNDERFEHAKVRYVMQRVGLSKRVSELQRTISSNRDEQVLSFEAFRSAFPDFPVQLTCVNINKPPLHRDRHAVHPRWFRNFRHLPFYKPYAEFYENVGDGLTPVGLIFPRKGFQQGLVLHNGPLEEYVPSNGGAHVYVGGGKEPMTLVVQPLSCLLDQIYRKGRGWKPSADSL